MIKYVSYRVPVRYTTTLFRYSGRGQGEGSSSIAQALRQLQGVLVIFACVLAFTSSVRAEDSKPFEVYPADVALDSAVDAQSLVVHRTDPSGVTHDLTSAVQITVADPKIAKVEGNVIRPLADGTSQVIVKHASGSVSVPLTVKNAQVTPPISMKLDVMPVFFKAGCNSGACHGAARGKDGFRLSLFGFDADGDYFRLTREIANRRINLSIPEESLLLMKGTGKVAHTGGTRFREGDALYTTVLKWIEAGVPQDSAAVAKPVAIELYPKSMVLEGEKDTQRITVRAKYSDGTDRDVTSLAVYSSNNDNSAVVSTDGVVTSGKRGEAFIMARFATFATGAQAIVIPKGVDFTFPAVSENNYIDTYVNAKLKKLRIKPSELCSDEVFIRRVYIDVVGQLPTPEEVEAFVSAKDSEKREKLVDKLLQRPEFTEMWVMKWAELLQIRSNQDRVSYKAALLYYNWLKDKIARNVPFDEIVQELLSSTGGNFTNPASNYYQVETDTLKVAENTAQVFMGMRIQCSQCHNHPFDRWTMDDYYSFAAFFSQVGRKKGEDPRETIISNNGGGEVNHPVLQKPLAPRFLGVPVEPDVKNKDRREVLAKWLASPENPYFAKNLANIVWAHFLGKGIIDQVDDVRVSNPAVNPELLEALGQKFTEYKYDFRRLVRDICTSRTYQLATEANESNAEDSRNFSHAMIRRVRAEVLLDCISQVTETKEKFKGLPLGARAVQIADGQTSNYFLTTFGRATRDTVCSCEVVMEPNLSQALHLLNGSTVNQKVQQGGLVKKLLVDEKKTPPQVIEELYLRTLGRKPTQKESGKLLAKLPAEAKEQQKFLEDSFWALLNSREFIFNH